ATVVRTVDSGASKQIEQTRVAVSGSLLREEWTERGQHRALILRPDLGKSYVLWLDTREYTESDFGSSVIDGAPPETVIAGKAAISSGEPKREGASQTEPEAKSPGPVGASDLDECCIDPDEAAPSVTSEVRDLPSQTIDGHECKVREEIRHFADGHTERVVSYNAVDVNGLAVRIEAESGSGPTTSRVITERRDVTLNVPASEFVVPEGFKPVEHISAKAR
ncbi:MAG TPA: hypothetical protein VI756_19365, partial [Blastocatellia bacterium]